ALEKAEFAPGDEQDRQRQRHRQHHPGRADQERKEEAGDAAAEVYQLAGVLRVRMPEAAPELRDGDEREEDPGEDHRTAQVLGCQPVAHPATSWTSSRMKAL